MKNHRKMTFFGFAIFFEGVLNDLGKFDEQEKFLNLFGQACAKFEKNRSARIDAIKVFRKLSAQFNGGLTIT
jgi:hypothetical protein